MPCSPSQDESRRETADSDFSGISVSIKINFIAFKPLRRPADGELIKATIANSVTVTIGGMITVAATGHVKFVTPATATSHYILGVVVGIEQNGKISELNSVGAASDNETTAKYVAVFLPSYVPMEYEADIDDVADTTTDSGGRVFFTLADANTLDESVIILQGGTVAGDTAYPHFWSNGVTSYNTKKVTGHIGTLKQL